MVNLTKLLKDAQRLPAFNWNYTFFGSHLQKVKQGWYYPQESHAAFEIIYVLEGIEQIEFTTLSYQLKAGDFTVIAPNTSHRCKAIEDLTYFVFHFDLDDPSLEEMLIGNPKLVYNQNSTATKPITDRLDKMIELIAQNKAGNFTFGDRIKIQVELSLVIYSLYESIKTINVNVNLYNVQYAKRMRIYIKNALQQRVYNSEDQANLASNDIIQDVCKQLNLSVGYASRIFKDSYGLSPKAYLSSVKQQIAQNLLLKPQYSINQISEMLGYKNSGNFSRQFKIWTGFSPKQFRNRNANYFLDKNLFSQNFITYNEDPDNDVYRSFDDD